MALHPARKRPLPKGRPPHTSRYQGARMTEEEYLSLPEEKPYLEYVDGMVLQKPTPNHRQIVRRLDALFDAYIQQHGGDGGPEGRVRTRGGMRYRLPVTAF